jgi:general secretion pathway protein D
MNSKSFRTGVGILALALVCGVSAQTLSGVSAKSLYGGTQLQINGDDLGQPKQSWSKSHRTLFLTFNGKLSSKPKTVKVGANGLNSATLSWADRKPAKVRVALNLDKSAKPEVVKTDGLWAVNFNVGEAPQTAVASPKFPDRLPPINDSFKSVEVMANNVPTSAFSSGVKVDLDFVNTDIVQILKALALQANVNIVTSPDVSGKVTVTLEGVSVKDALDIVTALGGVRYAKVGNTFVVTSNSRFSDTIQQIGGRIDVSSETRVVPLYSGEGTQIKAAVLKTVNPSTISGRYDLVLPSDKVTVENTQNMQPTNPADAQANNNPTGTEIKTSSGTGTAAKRDDYMVVVGTPSRMDEVVQMIRSIDRQICVAMGIKTTEGTGMVQKTYEPKGIAAEDLLRVLKSDPSSFGNVKVLATPKDSLSRQALVLSGRAAEVEDLLSVLQSLDTVQSGPTEFAIIGIKYVKPQVALAQLTDTYPGLRGSLLPAPVDPMVGISYSGSKLNNDMNAAKTNQGGAGTGDENNQQTSSQVTAGGSSPVGTSLTKDNVASGLALGEHESGGTGKSNSVPMKLLLRGTRAQIDEARRFIEMIDVAPKQVAVEVRVMELSRDDALKIGLDWSLLTGGSLTSLRINQGLGTASQTGGIGADLGFKGGGTASILGALDSIANKNNLLARPNMLATDGVPSTVFVGDTVRYVKSLQSTQNGTTVVTDEINVGVDFSLLARIGEGGNISIELNPVLAILQGFTDVPGGGKLPQTSVRSARMQVNIMSGETIAIGGLIQEQDRKSYGGIPILKDLPIIGHLFGRTDNRKVRSEVVFFVTVKEVNPSNRGGAANPRESERTNTDLPGSGKGG